MISTTYHRGLHRSDDCPAAQPAQHVQRIVDEIENEIGDEPTARVDHRGTGSNGGHGQRRVEAAVHEILTEIARPDRQASSDAGRVHRCTPN